MYLSESSWGARAVLAALYLRGLERPALPRRSAWPLVLSALRRASLPSLGSAEPVLREAGLWAEAAVLSTPGLLARAEALAAQGQVLSAACPGYPLAWARLGASAPPAMWCSGVPSTASWVAVVGGRSVPESALTFARSVAAESVRLGFGVVSGGAWGCDSAAAEAVLRSEGPLLVVLPHGLSLAPAGPSEAVRLSLAAPSEPFSAALAMERNALIYAASELAVVCHARFREGGSWHGAVEALRRRLARLAVRHAPELPGHAALAALGAVPLAEPSGLGALLSEPLAGTHPAGQGLLAFG